LRGICERAGAIWCFHSRPIDWRNRFVLPGKGRARGGVSGDGINVAPSLSTCAQLKRDDIFTQSAHGSFCFCSFSSALSKSTSCVEKDAPATPFQLLWDSAARNSFSGDAHAKLIFMLRGLCTSSAISLALDLQNASPLSAQPLSVPTHPFVLNFYHLSLPLLDNGFSIL
jgi:hypothetical protein